MPTITGLFPRAPSVYGRRYTGEKEHILDLVHNTYKRCYFKDCEIIIADTTMTNITQSLTQCQFDDCEITIIKRVPLDSPENKMATQATQLILTPVACHIDVKAQKASDKNLITCRLDHALKDKLGQRRSVELLKQMMHQGQEFAYRFC